MEKKNKLNHLLHSLQILQFFKCGSLGSLNEEAVGFGGVCDARVEFGRRTHKPSAVEQSHRLTTRQQSEDRSGAGPLSQQSDLQIWKAKKTLGMEDV